MQRAQEWVGKLHNVIFAGDGEGLGKNIVMVSFHKDYSTYADFMRSYALDWGAVTGGFESFLVRLESGYKMKPFDLKYLGDDVWTHALTSLCVQNVYILKIRYMLSWLGRESISYPSNSFLSIALLNYFFAS